MVAMSAAEDSVDSSSFIILDETGDATLIGLQSQEDSKENKMKTPNVQAVAGGSPAKRGSGRKRKRVSRRTPVHSAKKSVLMPLSTPCGTQGGPGSSKKMRKKKSNRLRPKSSPIVIVSDSESETSPEQGQSNPDVSIVEIDDDSHSVIVLSDDEVGVCSGLVSSHEPRIDRQPFVSRIHSKLKVLPQAPHRRRAPPTSSSSGQSTSKTVPVVEDLTGNYISNKNAELYQPLADKNERRPGSLRPIVIDGSNVAFGFSRSRCFSSLGLKICVDYFKQKGHEVVALVPQFRKSHSSTMDPQLLDAMEKEGTLVFTPSRRVDNKMIVSYDDRFIVQYADANGGVIVSRDNYRDVIAATPEWTETVQKRLLMFTWINGTLIFPSDPLGRNGPTLDEFLRF